MKEERGARYVGIISALEPTLEINTWATGPGGRNGRGECRGANGRRPGFAQSGCVSKFIGFGHWYVVVPTSHGVPLGLAKASW